MLCAGRTKTRTMRNNYDEDDDYDYSPNEFVYMPNDKYRQIVQSNLSDDDTVEAWEQRNLEIAKDFLAHQRVNRR